MNTSVNALLRGSADLADEISGLVAPPGQEEIAGETRRAFGLYDGRRWDAALAAYERLAQRHPQDPLFAIFV